MDISLSETQELLKASIDDYIDREVPFSRIREVEASGDYDRSLWEELAKQDWLSLPFSEEVGGQGAELTDLGVMLEAIHKRAVLVPLVETITAGVVIDRLAPRDVAKEVIPSITSGRMTISPAVLEQSDRFDAIEATVRDGKLTGEKHFVDYGHLVTHHLVAANDAGEVGLFLVDVSGDDVQFEETPNVGSVPQASATYRDVPARKVAGAEGVDFLLSLARTLSAVQCLAFSQQALDMTVDYVGLRVQFGRPIGAFQAVQHDCADMAIQTTASRFLTYEALWNLDRGTSTSTQINLAKAQASRAACFVPMRAHVLHGGFGIVTEYDLQFISRRGKQASISWGSADECMQEVADGIEVAEPWL